ncbi:MAG: methionine ABC transporter ATP-binding protein [Spirochaetaceae bacterium]|jgi:D-methionine transport system ATP-binding protein|nr:methionine ABC transporter ATP-binding protein [Spirochaetaceae bacterium]
MIEIKRLRKMYNGVSILNDVTANIPRGSIFGVIGQSGSGKSTLLRCVNGLEKFNGGAIYVDGVSVGDMDKSALRQLRKNIGMIFQDFALLERKTVFENVCLPMECWNYSPNEKKEKAVSLLKRVGLENKMYAMPRELSGGQKQRVAIARALTLDPKVLLCDEATSALDPQITESILDLLADINSELGLTIMLVTHEMEAVKRICDRVAILSGGNIPLEGTVSDVFMSEHYALVNLVKTPRFQAEKGKTILRISVIDNETQADVLYTLAKIVSYRLVYAGMSAFRGKIQGHLYLEIDYAQFLETSAYLRKRGLVFREEDKKIC